MYVLCVIIFACVFFVHAWQGIIARALLFQFVCKHALVVCASLPPVIMPTTTANMVYNIIAYAKVKSSLNLLHFMDIYTYCTSTCTLCMYNTCTSTCTLCMYIHVCSLCIYTCIHVTVYLEAPLVSTIHNANSSSVEEGIIIIVIE